MAGSVFDSVMFRDLFGDPEVGKLFTDNAEVRAMLLVEGTLARVQADMGIIPAESGAAIQRASIEAQIDPASLASETGKNAVMVPALVNAFRNAMNAPEHAQYIHWGATSQDIIDTGLVLRLRQVVSIYESRLQALAKELGVLAKTYADLPMAGRTYGQISTVTSFGAVVASWGIPVIRHLDRLNELKPRLLQVSLSGASGTLSALGREGGKVRAALASSLKLADPQTSWHSTRDTVAELSGWTTLVSGTLGKIGEDLILMTQSGIREITLSQGGSSSTMPQKSNPVLPSLLVSLARQSNALNLSVQGAILHRQQRDGAAWLCEWMSVPQLILGTARGLSATLELVSGISPNADRMANNIDDGLGLIYAEALSFELAKTMRRPDAQSEVKQLCNTTLDTQVPLGQLASEKWPKLNLAKIFTPSQQLGTAPQDAELFAAAAKAL